MSYRESWIEDILEGRSLIACALDVHLTTVGTLRRPAVRQSEDMSVLVHKLDNWKAGINPDTERFDNAAKELIAAAVSGEHRRLLDRVCKELRGSHAV